jgi:hypothetical protein
LAELGEIARRLWLAVAAREPAVKLDTAARPNFSRYSTEAFTLWHFGLYLPSSALNASAKLNRSNASLDSISGI